MNELANPTSGVFDTVIGGPAAVPYGVGWGLLVVGTLWSLSVSQAKNMMGMRSDPLAAWVQSAILAIGLSFYTFLSRAVWWSTQTIASEIFPDSRLQALGKALKDVAKAFLARTFTFSLTDVSQGIKDSVVSFTGLTSWMIAILSHWQIQQIQQGVYNVVFVFGPILIGLAAFGLPTARIWVMALVEVSSWSITSAALYFGLQTQFERYLRAGSSPDVLDTQFLDVMSNLFFLSSMMIVVPVATGRLLGSSTLGELGRISPRETLAGQAAGWMRSLQPHAGPDAATGTGGAAPHASANPARSRPGDA